MAERLNVVPDELRQAAGEHRDTAEHLAAVPSGHADLLATLESLGPIFAEFREAGREEVEVVFADDAGLVRDAKAVHETLAGTHEAELRVLGEKSKVRQVIEQPVERTVRTDTTDETFAQCGRRFEAWRWAAHAPVSTMRIKSANAARHTRRYP